MSDPLPQIDISKEQTDEVWGMIQDSIAPGAEELPSKVDLGRQTSRPQYKPRKQKKQQEVIKVGDWVNKSGNLGNVIDIDGDLLCVKNIWHDVEVWNIKDVKLVKWKVKEEML